MIEIERAREARGADPAFDLRRFHDRVLELGQLPLPRSAARWGSMTEQGRLGRVTTHRGRLGMQVDIRYSRRSRSA